MDFTSSSNFENRSSYSDMQNHSDYLLNNNISLESQFFDAYEEGEKDRAITIIDRIGSFTSLNNISAEVIKIYSRVHNSKMNDVLVEIHNKKFLLLLEACESGNPEEFMEIYKRIGKYIFGHQEYTTDDITRILGTYSFILEKNWEEGRPTSVDSNSIFNRHYMSEPSDRQPCVKRCMQQSRLRHERVRYLNSPEDKKTNDVVLGSQLLNACENFNSDEAFDVLSLITSFESLKMKNKHEETAFSCATNNGMNRVAEEITNKKFSLLLDTCKNHDLKEFTHIYKQIGSDVLKHEKYTSDDISLILGTYSDILKENVENGLKTDADLVSIANSSSSTIALNGRSYLKRSAEVEPCNARRNGNHSVPSEQDEAIELDEKTRAIVLGTQLLNACKSKDAALASNLIPNITNYESLKVKDKDGKNPFIYAMTYRKEGLMGDVATQIHDKKFSLLLEACNKRDFAVFMRIYNDIKECVYTHKKYSDEDRALISQIHLEAASILS